MEAYSKDLRERIVWECDLGIDTREEIADRYGVSTSFIRKLLQRRQSGQPRIWGRQAPRRSKPSLLRTQGDGSKIVVMWYTDLQTALVVRHSFISGWKFIIYIEGIIGKEA